LKQTLPAICLIAGGLIEVNIRLQPWRYLHEVAHQLTAQGYPVTLLSDGASHSQPPQWLEGVRVQRLPSVSQSQWRANRALPAALREIKPELVLWHVGLTSFLHQSFETGLDIPTLGIFSSPLYQPQEILRLALRKLAEGYRLSAMHILGTLTPRFCLRRLAQRSKLQALVVQTQTTRRQLLESGVWSRPIEVISPGVDEIWIRPQKPGETRARLGHNPADKVVLYFGSPAPLRGLPTLIEAFELARHTDPSLKLVILSRRRADELFREDTRLRQQLAHPSISRHVQVVSGFLAEQDLVSYVAASDIVALPFELIPSDAPLSLLEAQALGKPVVTTAVGCLAELTSGGMSYLAQPADPTSLTGALLQAAEGLGNRVTLETSHSPVRRWSEVGQEWSEFIQKLLNRRGTMHFERSPKQALDSISTEKVLR
jgi:glycosyltransferase involved in cell wall biosynthesis